MAWTELRGGCLLSVHRSSSPGLLEGATDFPRDSRVSAMRAGPRLGRRKASNNASNATSTEHHEHDTTVSDVKPTFAGVMLPKESSDGSTRGENQQDLIGDTI